MLGSDLYRCRWDERRKELRLSTWVYIHSEEGKREGEEGEESEESAENEGIERGEKPFCKCSKRKHNIYAMAEHVCVWGQGLTRICWSVLATFPFPSLLPSPFTHTA